MSFEIEIEIEKKIKAKQSRGDAWGKSQREK